MSLWRRHETGRDGSAAGTSGRGKEAPTDGLPVRETAGCLEPQPAAAFAALSLRSNVGNDYTYRNNTDGAFEHQKEIFIAIELRLRPYAQKEDRLA